MIEARIESVRTGRVRDLPRPDWDRHARRTWRSGYLKDAREGPVALGPLGLEGDEQASRDVHGGPHMAVLAYAARHYEAWRAETGIAEMGPGGFGENLVLEGLDEREVCVGDVFEAQGARLEVSQPRGPCANIARRWNRPDLLDRAVASGRTGWYLRVLRPGSLAAGEVLRVVDRPHQAWTVERVFRCHVARQLDPAEAAALAALPALSPRWRERFAVRAAGRGAGS